MLLSAVQASSAVRNWSVETGGKVQRTVSAYRTATLEEAILNAVAHQDYALGGTIDVIERDKESVTIRSGGSFGSQQPESFALGRASPHPSRNRFLREAMSKSGITMGHGSGIRGMYLSQAYRHFPMPSYYIDDSCVSVTIPGVRFGLLPRMMDSRELSLEDAIDLDRVCSGRFVPERRMRGLIERGLVDTAGGIPCPVAGVPEPRRITDREAVLELLRSGPVTRSEVAELLRSRTARPMTTEQLSVKATNLLQSLRREGRLVKSAGSTKSASYELSDGSRD
jgi:ATP-dependent DNA helicase RecG